jgi:hypothetical protein
MAFSYLARHSDGLEAAAAVVTRRIKRRGVGVLSGRLCEKGSLRSAKSKQTRLI